MVTRKTLWKTIKSYCVLQLTSLAILFHILKFYLMKKITSFVGIYKEGILYHIYSLLITVALLLLWIMVFLSIYRQQRYKVLTGRNYRNDSAKYRPMSYYQLIDYFKDADPHKLDTSPFEEISWKDASGIVFGTADHKLITIPSNCESNIAVFGPPGSSKTAGFAIINAITFHGSVLAIDIKGDIYNYCRQKRRIVRFCPDHPNAVMESCRFNPLAGINQMSTTDRKLYLESMATVLIPDEGGSDGNYFSSRARKYFQGIAHLLLSTDPEITFPNIVHAILEGNAFTWVTKAMKSNCLEAKEMLSSFYGNSEKNIAGAYDNLCTAMASFANPVLDILLDGKGPCISVETLEQGYDIYLQINQEHLDTYAPLFTLLIQSISTGFTRRPDSSYGVQNRPILMLLDEFPQLTFSYRLINSNLSTLRSKSIVIALIQQNLAQLEYRYNPTGARSILGNCNYQLILGSNDIHSSKVFSETFGKKRTLKVSSSQSHTSKSSSMGRSIQMTEEQCYTPESFGDLTSTNSMILYFKGKHIKGTKLNCYINT